MFSTYCTSKIPRFAFSVIDVCDHFNGRKVTLYEQVVNRGLLVFGHFNPNDGVAEKDDDKGDPKGDEHRILL